MLREGKWKKLGWMQSKNLWNKQQIQMPKIISKGKNQIDQ